MGARCHQAQPAGGNHPVRCHGAPGGSVLAQWAPDASAWGRDAPSGIRFERQEGTLMMEGPRPASFYLSVQAGDQCNKAAAVGWQDAAGPQRPSVHPRSLGQPARAARSSTPAS